jgi:hypothetical protein
VSSTTDTASKGKTRGPRAPKRNEEPTSLVGTKARLDAALRDIEKADGQMLARAEQIKGLVERCVGKIDEMELTLKALALLPQNEDRPFPAKLYCAVWVSRGTISRYVREGMGHCYLEGHLSITPREFFKFYERSRTSVSPRNPQKTNPNQQKTP